MPTVISGDSTLITEGLFASISNATNASPIVIETSAAHLYSTGDLVFISGVAGNTAANGEFTITVVDATHFSLNGSTGNGAYTSGGSAVDWSLTPAFQIPSDGDPRHAASVNVALELLAARTQFLQKSKYQQYKHPLRWAEFLSAIIATPASHGDLFIHLENVLGGIPKQHIYHWDEAFDLTTHPANSPYWFAGASTIGNLGAWIRERRSYDTIDMRRVVGTGNTTFNTGLFQMVVLTGPVNLSTQILANVKVGDLIRIQATVSVITAGRPTTFRTRYNDGAVVTVGSANANRNDAGNNDVQMVSWLDQFTVIADATSPTVFVEGVDDVVGAGVSAASGPCTLDVQLIRP